jgi:hypothetical protein
MVSYMRRRTIRRLVPAFAAIAVALVVVPHARSASLSLALSRHDYPKGVKIGALPATNTNAQMYFGPAHRSSFDKLRRLDGEGWIQAGLWQFSTGRGAAVRLHRTVFVYGIHVFKGSHGALRALHDVKLRTRAFQVAHLPTRLYRLSDVRGTLVFDFFSIGAVEVESYYQYRGVAPRSVRAIIDQKYSTQRSHLVALARKYSAALKAHPTSTPRPTAVPTDTATPTATATAAPTATETPTARPTATASSTIVASPTATSQPVATPVPTSTPTATPTITPPASSQGVAVTAKPEAPAYAVGDLANVDIAVTFNGAASSNATVSATYAFPGSPEKFVGHTDADGHIVFSGPVPQEPPGTVVVISVEVTTVTGGTGQTTTSFTVT